MLYQFKNPKLYVMLLLDVLLFVLAHVAAYLVRFEWELNQQYIDIIKVTLPYLVILKLAVFYVFGNYQGLWRYVSINDFWRLVLASAVSSLLLLQFVFLSKLFIGFPRTVFLLDGCFTFLFTGGLRMAIRSFFAIHEGRTVQGVFLPVISKRRQAYERVLIIGAGRAGEKALREIFDNPEMHYHPVGVLDDDPNKRSRSVHGVKVLGPVDDLPRLVGKLGVRKVFIAISSATGADMRRIVDICKSCGVSFKRLPGIGEIMDGKVGIKTLRDVNYEDLLGRPQVRLDTDDIRAYLEHRTVLVTGCGGSIGSELCRQLIQYDPAALILVDASEENLYQIEMELRCEFNYLRCTPILGRIQAPPLMESVFRKHHPEVVFHAAAYKHVPMLEKNPWEAVFNNILGSRMVMQMAADHAVERFVLVSTDKAVRPTNVMGASKRITELILQSLQGNTTRFMAVRFGNVVGSSGSVIPLFRRQIEHGGPVTVTDAEVTRYFMTIPEAAQLILQAGAMGEAGEIFILEMGTPVNIADMARDLIRLSGKEPDKDIEVIFTGLREGEKLFEELITEGEGIVSTPHEKIMVLRSDGNWNGHGNQAGFRMWLEGQIEELNAVARKQDGAGIKRKLREIVPEYEPQEVETVV
jgi:FlaA1/EpsC-like NDP-sugar epimerase